MKTWHVHVRRSFAVCSQEDQQVEIETSFYSAEEMESFFFPVLQTTGRYQKDHEAQWVQDRPKSFPQKTIGGTTYYPQAALRHQRFKCSALLSAPRDAFSGRPELMLLRDWNAPEIPHLKHVGFVVEGRRTFKRAKVRQGTDGKTDQSVPVIADGLKPCFAAWSRANGCAFEASPLHAIEWMSDGILQTKKIYKSRSGLGVLCSVEPMFNRKSRQFCGSAVSLILCCYRVADHVLGQSDHLQYSLELLRFNSDQLFPDWQVEKERIIAPEWISTIRRALSGFNAQCAPFIFDQGLGSRRKHAVTP